MPVEILYFVIGAIALIVLVLVWRMDPSRFRLHFKLPGVQLEVESERPESRRRLEGPN